jgi:uncharacterized protein (DUF2249 family)
MNPVTTIDVREDLRSGREPFSRIMSAVAALGPTEPLLLIAPFEPVPLFRVMESRGFSHSARQSESGDWEVLFTRSTGEAPPVSPRAPVETQDTASAAAAIFVELDARGLEPPQPLVKILEAVATLASGVGLRARTDRRPMHLYAPLEERGCSADTQEQPDGTFLTIIQRR